MMATFKARNRIIVENVFKKQTSVINLFSVMLQWETEISDNWDFI